MSKSATLLLLVIIFTAGPACYDSAATDTATPPDQRSGRVGLQSKKEFFDLAGFVDQEIETLNLAKRTITKKVTIDGKSEEKKLDATDFTNDLDLFRKADINKPAWIEKYRIETVGNDTSYIATDSSLRTRHLQVLRNENNEVQRIEIKRRSGNVLSSGSQELSYHKDSGYRIYSRQIGDLVGDAEVSVEVKF
ncbi:hypothetical protein CEQ90_11895 [Lewinellaceae bacterium SD302]|nr:hypothetical protein CEQ90_11895 [Lewinellaceae bacterium SD302]